VEGYKVYHTEWEAGICSCGEGLEESCWEGHG
jgi:hypothetical protein